MWAWYGSTRGRPRTGRQVDVKMGFEACGPCFDFLEMWTSPWTVRLESTDTILEGSCGEHVKCGLSVDYFYQSTPTCLSLWTDSGPTMDSPRTPSRSVVVASTEGESVDYRGLELWTTCIQLKRCGVRGLNEHVRGL
jgi:hypothetical protein